MKQQIKTATELMLEQQAIDMLVRINEALKIVLDFVERYNKQDYEKEVADAANFLSSL